MTKLEPWVVPNDDESLGAVRQLLTSKSMKPLWFHHDGQFWACWEIMMVAYVACEIMTRNQVMAYRHLLQFIQEGIKGEGNNPMIIWLYNMNVRASLAKNSDYDNTTLED